MFSVLQYPFMTTGSVAAGMCFPRTSGICSSACGAPFYGYGCGCNKTPFLTSYYNSLSLNCQGTNPVYNWILYGQLGQSQSVVPTYSTQFVTAQGRNRTLTDVSVGPITPSQITVALAVGAVATFNIAQSASVVSSSPTIATATISNGVVSVTGVAAGSTTITIKDSAGNTVSTIVATVA